MGSTFQKVSIFLPQQPTLMWLTQRVSESRALPATGHCSQSAMMCCVSGSKHDGSYWQHCSWYSHQATNQAITAPSCHRPEAPPRAAHWSWHQAFNSWPVLMDIDLLVTLSSQGDIAEVLSDFLKRSWHSSGSRSTWDRTFPMLTWCCGLLLATDLTV